MTMRPCWVEISTRSLEDNYRFLSSLAGGSAELLAVVKSDAYGHSLALCAPAAVRAGARWLGVTSVEEAVEARALCSEARVLVMSGCFPGEGAALVEHGLTAVAWEPSQLDELEHAARFAGLAPGSMPVHLEIDTGMSRQGVGPEGLDLILGRFPAASPLRLEGVLTHLFAADETDGRATEEQLARLDEALAQIAAAGLQPEWLSVGASATLLNGDASGLAVRARRWGMKAMIRPGLALYGVAPQFEPDEPPAVAAARKRLKPVLTWKTRIVGVRSVPAGAQVGYNGTFVATEPLRLALLPVGYADGLDRRVGNRFSLLVRGERAPLVGRISMDLAVLDVTEIDGVDAGDEVVILGRQGSQTITAYEHAKATGTIPWEVFTRIGARVRRVLV
ncbi:MAG TPA: alanine racemase [Terracidiphilus sp.]|nr:alanine racemase [Terracidiphilus sp.]